MIPRKTVLALFSFFFFFSFLALIIIIIIGNNVKIAYIDRYQDIDLSKLFKYFDIEMMRSISILVVGKGIFRRTRYIETWNKFREYVLNKYGNTRARESYIDLELKCAMELWIQTNGRNEHAKKNKNISHKREYEILKELENKGLTDYEDFINNKGLVDKIIGDIAGRTPITIRRYWDFIRKRYKIIDE